MDQLTRIVRPDGKDCPAYVALPPGSMAGGIVVIQEWWGLNAQIKKVGDRLAAAGYAAVVPDLYRGKLATAADEASHFMGQLDFVDAATQDVRGSVSHLKALGAGKVAVGGFCMGGALTLLAAMKVPEVDAGVCFYGIPPAEAGDPGTIKVPLLCHFATRDGWCTPGNVSALEARLASGNVPHELHCYEADHAFMNEARPEVYDAASARLAWDRTLAFLGRTLR
jgi:carboxymethylenebutenolidase